MRTWRTWGSQSGRVTPWSTPGVSTTGRALQCTSRFTAIPREDTTSSLVSRVWTAPVQEPFMVYWRNDQPVRVNVTYAFNLLPAQSDIWPLYIAPLGIVLVAAVGLFFKFKERRTRPPE